MSPSPYYILILSIFTFHTHLNGKKTDFNPFFILYHHPHFVQNIFTFFFYIGKIQPLFLKMKGIFSSPKQSICIFPENI